MNAISNSRIVGEITPDKTIPSWLDRAVGNSISLSVPTPLSASFQRFRILVPTSDTGTKATYDQITEFSSVSFLMDGLSTTASVVAVIQLAKGIVNICGGYIQGVKDSTEEIKSLQHQVADLQVALEKLSELRQRPGGNKVPTSQTLIDDANQSLKTLEKKIKPRSKRKFMSKPWARSLMWPLTRTEVKKILKELESYVSSFTFSLELYQSGLVTDVSHITDLIDRKIDFSKLPVADGAEFNSYENRNEAFCLPGTRAELLRQIAEWSVSPQGKCIFCLCGMAGTGKSTISRTVAESFEKNKLLGASFFFKRGEGDRGNAKRLFTTITKQIMAHIRVPYLELGVQKAISDDPDIAGKSLKEQFEKLLLQPLLSLKRSKDANPSMIIIVIDALDECEDDRDIKVILELLPRLSEAKAVHVRTFLTSRPDLPISRNFSKIATEDYQHLILHEIPEAVTERDISLFLDFRLSQIRKERLLPVDWPGVTDIRKLVTLSVPLFIFAATVCRIFDDDNWDPVDSLTEILTHRHEESKLAQTYLPVLNRFLKNKSEKQKEQLVQEFKDIVGAIVILQHPLSTSSLSRLIGLPEKLINLRLNPLHSVLRVPRNENKPVRLFHLSFRDFLLHEKTQFWVDEEDMHQMLTTRCFFVCDNLRRNVCGLPNDGTPRAEIDRQTIDDCLYPELQYSCRYWAYHLKHFLHWVEAMSILGLVSETVVIIDRLQLDMPSNKPHGISEFLLDAKRFILKNRQMADNVPLQLYSSGLVFAPKMAIIRKEFEKELPSRIWRLPEVEETWSAELQTLESHSGRVTSVAFSPDGGLLASGSDDNTIKLWDTASGALRQTLESHSDWVRSVDFSSNGRLLASGSDDNTIKLWDIATGTLHQTLKSHSDRVISVTFSPDSRALASSSVDRTVKLWDITKNTLYQTFEGHSDWVVSVAFSPNGRFLASGSIDKSVKLWDTTLGILHHTFNGHSDSVRSVAFSSLGQLLASGSDDRSIKLWDIGLGVLYHTFDGHSDSVRSVAFSSLGQLLASGSDDRSIKLWDISLGVSLQTLKGHLDPIRSVAFSVDGQLLASGSVDNTIKLWDIGINALHQTPESHSNRVRSVAFSPDSQLLASGSDDNTVKLWNTATGTLHLTLDSHSSWVRSVAFSPDSLIVASGSIDRTVKLWDTATGTLRQTLEGHSDRVWSVVFSHNGRLLASGSDDKTIKLWDIASGALYLTLEGHSGWVMSVAFSPDGRLLASGSNDKTVKLWDVATGALHLTLEGHSDWIKSVVFSSDGRTVASGSVDDTVKLWDTATGAPHQTLESQSGPIRSVALSEDGSYTSTNLGFLHAPSFCDKITSNSSRAKVEISILKHRWVTLNGEKALWLPPEYRPTCSAIKDSVLALGHASGRISFIGFCA
ncbi:hypothetical protein PENCOP_c016G07939 [Penicillium coprophilum]|uniref:Nephrocystin 3-like N-terminal domain-containing protein n=1 Tax=Penicillium coprophilum TaxID=36646 RepID=A0A1V6U895_9EURO|nr:hypothetical protein PENCOP_c016G07939 [Penicillium coprophilum]